MRHEYPRHDFQRESFLCLEDVWDFSFDDDSAVISGKWFSRPDYQEKNPGSFLLLVRTERNP